MGRSNVPFGVLFVFLLDTLKLNQLLIKIICRGSGKVNFFTYFLSPSAVLFHFLPTALSVSLPLFCSHGIRTWGYWRLLSPSECAKKNACLTSGTERSMTALPGEGLIILSKEHSWTRSFKKNPNCASAIHISCLYTSVDKPCGVFFGNILHPWSWCCHLLFFFSFTLHLTMPRSVTVDYSCSQCHLSPTVPNVITREKWAFASYFEIGTFTMAIQVLFPCK